MQAQPSRGAASAAGSAGAWGPDLDAYVATHPEEEGGAGGSSVERLRLVAGVKAAPECADAWHALLCYEEAHHANQTQHGAGAQQQDSGRVSLYHLYVHATKLVPRSRRDAYLQLWLGYARQAWPRGADEARDIFKTLKNQHLADTRAAMYHEWAVLEHSAGNVSKALGIIAKGLRADAQPASMLEQLRSELQSGTFDLKAAAATLTETITLDAGAVAARHAVSTPAPPTTAGPRPAQAVPHSSSRPPGSVLAAAAHSTRGGGSAIASCLKAPAAAAAAAGAGGPQEHHVARAVTFAADVHDAPHEPLVHGHRAGALSASSHRSSAHNTTDGHSGCLSVSSLSSRSTASAHDGTLPFTGSVVSYKSSTTESSGMDGAEEDTISCRVAGAAAAAAGGSSSSRDAAGRAKPSTAPLAGGGQATCGTPAAACSHAAANANTATLGLKRFGFKSRALRVGGAADAPAAGSSEEAAHAGSAATPAAAAAPGSVAAGPGSSAAAGAAARADHGIAASGRKRHAGSGSMPSPSTSPKLAAALSEDGQYKVQAHSTARHSSMRTADPVSAAAVAGSSEHAGAASTDSDESVPLVSSKLAARLNAERGTPGMPAAADRGKAAVTHGLGLWSSPVEGQLPSSLEATPSEGINTAAAAAAGGRDSRTAPSGRHALMDLQAPQQQQHASASSLDQQQLRSSLEASVSVQQRQQQPAAAASQPGGHTAMGEVSPLPTLVLQEAVPAATRTAAATAAPAGKQAQPQQLSGTAGAQRQQQQSLHPPAAAPREPLRPLQSHAPQAAGGQPAAGTDAGGKQQASDAAVASARTQQQQQQAAREQQQRQEQQAAMQQQQQQAAAAGQQQAQQQQQLQQQAPQPVRQDRPKEDAQTVFVQGVRYHKLECVGRGGSSKVFKVMGPGCKIYALKRIRLAGRDAEAASGFIDEINLLLCLKGKPNIIQLVDSQVFTEAGLIYMVQEYGEIDLARLLAKHDAARREAAARPDGRGGDLDENFIRLYWQQMLKAVAGVHEQRIVHSDLKPANFLLVEGQLKLIDFGIAKAICGDTTSIARESQVGTLNYMSPEAILGGSTNILGGPAMKVGRPSDVWSLGCILYQMVHGRTPFAELPFLPKMHAICNPQHRITYPELANKDLQDVMRRCLDRDPKSRISLQALLDHPFLHPNRSAQASAAPAPAPALSEEQMKQLVAQVQAAAAAGNTDLDALTRELMAKLAPHSGGSGSGSGAPRAGEQPAAAGAAASVAGTGSKSRIPTVPSWR